ncbi:MAG: hypothetical protein HN413_08195 [Chloroflexi bacterium]|jgi:hypothetical protein|nr:hypothetical protein [Chloroflexota bacterium]
MNLMNMKAGHVVASAAKECRMMMFQNGVKMLADKFTEMFRIMQSLEHSFDEFQDARSELYQLLLRADEIIAADPTSNGELGCSCGNLTTHTADLAICPDCNQPDPYHKISCARSVFYTPPSR